MSPNLPPVLPSTGKSLPISGSSSHAQDFSVSILNQKKDRDNAKVSMNQVLSGRTSSSAVTSVVHMVDRNQKAVSSVAHIGEAEQGADDFYDKDADDRRYEYMQRKMMSKRAEATVNDQVKEREEVSKDGAYGAIKMKTGSAFRTDSHVSSLKRQMYRLRKKNPLAFKNISDKDQKYYINLIKPYMKGVRPGVGIDRRNRRAMKYQIEMDRRKGIVSMQDAKDFWKMIDNLPH